MSKMILHNFISTSRLFLFACLIMFFSQSIQAQSWKMEDYAGIPSKDMRAIFSEDFVDDLNMWTERSQYLQCSLLPTQGQGVLIKSFLETGIHKCMSINFDPKKNFQVEGTLKWAKNTMPVPIGIVFGESNINDAYEFLINPEGTFSIIQKSKGGATVIQSQVPCASITKEGYNELMLRKVGGKWFFFINKNLIFECQAQDIIAKNIGFTIKGKASICANHFAIYELVSSDINKPILYITAPEQGERSNILKCGERNPSIKGKTNDISGIKEVRINDIPIPITKDGAFSYNVNIQDEYMNVRIDAMDNNGNTVSQTFILRYVPGYQKSSVVNNNEGIALLPDPIIPDNIQAASGPKGRQNYAVFIGVNDYEYWMDLNNTISDCKAVSKVLLEKYDFDASRMVFLYNKRASRIGILKVLDSMAQKLTENDNLLIYYAGHGAYDSLKLEGYWIPQEGQLDEPASYITNSDILASIRGMQAQHVFLISDACFSGSIFSRGESKPNEYSKSRWAFTSGGIEYVDDGIKGKNSPFAAALIQELQTNPMSAIRADDLIASVKVKVEHNARQKPVGMPIRDVGDSGGIFIFRRKKGH